MADRDGQDALNDGRPLTGPGSDQQYGDPEDANAAQLLTEKDLKKAAKLNYDLWKDQPKAALTRRTAQWQVNAWRREGRSNVFVQKTRDVDQWQAWAPPWNAPPVPVLNKADRLCRRLRSVVFADPPEPEAVPASGDDEDVEAAEFSERVLKDLQGAGQLDDLTKAARAFDRASVYGSGFIRYYVDQRGGGRKPVQVMAKPGAVTADRPFTGPNGEPLSGELLLRYVTAEGALTDTAAEAATRWMPGLKSELVGARNLRFLPYDCEDLWDADGVTIATMPTWGELEELWPDEMAKVSKEDRAAIETFRPEGGVKSLLEPGERSGEDDPKRRRDKRVAVFTTYYRSCPSYPEGCYFVGLGDRVTLHREPLSVELEGVRESMDIPVTQYGQFEAGRREPYFLGLMELLGGGAEIRGAQVGHLMTYLDQFINRKTFVPTNSIIQPKQYPLMQGTVIPVNPGGEPKFEEVPDFPQASTDLFQLMTTEMDDQAMMQQTAQGTEVPSVTSGKQAQIVVNQSKAGLSDVAQQTERGYLRACRIQLQLIRAYYSVPQQISWTGEDGQYRQRYFTGADLGSTRDVKLKQGSLSLMTDAEKVTMAMQFNQQGIYASNPEQFYDTVVGEMGAQVGLQDDPFRQRIKRQLAAWSEGPPKGWQPPQPPTQLVGDPATAQLSQQPVIDPATGQPQPAPPSPELAAIFEPQPADELQDVATIRLGELKRFTASTRFTRWPPEWRTGVVSEFARMKLCAGVLTVPEQQAAAQQAQEQAAQQTREGEDRGRAHEKEMAEAKQPVDMDHQIQRDPTGRAAGVQSRRVQKNGNGAAGR